ncbi:PDDEXK nuclease domain-containing protein [Stieleria sp. JC731]|uniref:PDDEXK nuclease domain-containing protein n=1 Tax=Pirellulaceae TaxID=2691357 RepID=UPI001E65BD9D|nr:PDDEXK nuclease domain-containing protein [Stieleria sp. JC731]MCC9600378.1 PDDEXK nuclease domain-containing protein [Stieleria sp. JC731]
MHTLRSSCQLDRDEFIGDHADGDETMSELAKTDEYRQWIVSIKDRVQASQIKAAMSVNRELMELYWFLGEQISEKQKTAKWGDSFLEQMSKDLLKEFPEIKGFSYRNLRSIRQWHAFWTQPAEIGKQAVSKTDSNWKQAVSNLSANAAQLVSQIPWGHNIVLVQKLDVPADALFYVQKTIENNWSRAVLTHQIESGLHLREGQAIHNFEATLPKPESDLAKQLLRDPYNFDFLALTERHNERELEDGLIEHLTKFLLELGAGFAFVGRQYKIDVDGDEYSIDLLFYHLRLHCYVVVELKVDKFKPEYAGKLNFYVSAVDSQVRTELDGPTIGILICKSKSDIKVEYSLRDLTKPIGVSEYQITENLPEQFRASIPSIEQIEAELGEWEDN